MRKLRRRRDPGSFVEEAEAPFMEAVRAEGSRKPDEAESEQELEDLGAESLSREEIVGPNTPEPVETNPIYEETVVDELISEDERRAREEKKISDAELPEEGEELNGDSGERGPLLP